MRVGVLAPPWIPIPATGYGGVEAVVEASAAGLAARGHDVTLVAAPGSAVNGARVVAHLPAAPDQIGLAGPEWEHVVAASGVLTDADVVIDHSGFLGALLSGLGEAPALHVVHGPIDGAPRDVYGRICALAPRLRLVAISEAQRRAGAGLPFAGVAHNGIDVDRLPLGRGGGYLAFLGRMSPDKGVVEAIAIARAAGLPLKIAAKCREPAERRHFERDVRPLLGDGAEWLGELDGEEKIALLAGAAALVFPIRWPEPFGLVMVEAMAVGTPVLATPCGSVPEVVRDGVTGFVRRTPQELAEAVAGLGRIEREECRRHVRERFSVEAMVDRYEALLEGARHRQEGTTRGRRAPRLRRAHLRSADTPAPAGPVA